MLGGGIRVHCVQGVSMLLSCCWGTVSMLLGYCVYVCFVVLYAVLFLFLGYYIVITLACFLSLFSLTLLSRTLHSLYSFHLFHSFADIYDFISIYPGQLLQKSTLSGSRLTVLAI